MNILQIDNQFLTDDWDTWSHFQAYIKVFPEKCSDHQCGEDSAEHGVKLSSDLLAAAHSVKHDQ